MFFKVIILLSLMILFSNYSYTQNMWDKEVSLNIEGKSLRDVLNEIRKQTKLNLIYDDKLTSEKFLTCNIKSTAEKVILEVLSKNGFLHKKFEDNSAVIYKNKLSPNKKVVVNKSNIVAEFLPSPAKILKPTLLSNIEPNYPYEAIKDRLEGEVLTRIFVTRKGNVSKVILEKSSGYKILDTATIDYVSKLSFLPAEYNGKYKSVWTTMLVKYNFK